MKTVRVIGLRYIDGTLSTRMLNDDIMLVLLEEALRDIPTLCVPPYTHLTNRTDANRDLPLSNVPNRMIM
ncbi:hypothetical protein BIW11_03460 [Tropilaelaps mercedesae]|uniref:Uncharacterized protein n=1 Tax=Tropilaelaps mercedesae TaxID=418985 RepID=A0A1V9XKZ8_9ACAR|nr:hypothetical protein BIW11_03460 [Tropilaelaps mercedesae]